jgi:hypothetical protein
MIELLFLIYVVVLAFSMGSIGLHILRFKTQGRVEWFLYGVSMGLGMIALLMSLLGFLGLLYDSAIYVLLIVLSFSLLFSYNRLKQAFILPKLSLKDTPLWQIGILGVFVLYVMYQLFNCMTPVINGDSIAWYLSVPKHFIENKSILNAQLSEDYISSNMPINLYMLSVLGIILRSEILSQLILGWLMSVLATLAIYVTIKPFSGEKIALLGAILVYTMPTMSWLIYSAKMDMGYLMFEMVFWSLLIRWFRTKNIRDIFVGAIFLGFGIGSKYHSLITLTCVFASLAIVLMMQKSKLKDVVRLLFIFSIMSLAVGAPSYVKNFLLTHNPFFPFLSGEVSLEGEGFNIYRNLTDFPRFAYNMIFRKDFLLSEMRMADKPLGFLTLVWIPFLSWRKIKTHLGILATILFYSIVMLILVMFSVWPFPRHILPAFALITIFGLINTGDIQSNKFTKVAGCVFFLMLMFQLATTFIGANMRDKIQYLVGSKTKFTYLADVLFNSPKSTHMNSSVMAYVQGMPPDTRILALDNGNGYYVSRPLL